MAEIAIAARNVFKTYRLSRSPYSRLLEFFSLTRPQDGQDPQDYQALTDITFEIPRGTTVGVIGRNGAGKSTLLRLLSGASTPTSGEVFINGRLSTLLEVGTGFHPDLTGHENIFASAVYLGLDRTAIEALYDDIVSFAELGNFLHQPVRTYSTGMYMRLAFSVATSIPADVQLIDEVLGVGDAVFFRKCLDRFRRFQEEGRTTLLVSHDQGMVMRLCSRCLWIDRGRVAAEGNALEVMAAYNEAIYDERDRSGRSEVSLSGMNLAAARELRMAKAIRIEDVAFKNGQGSVTHSFVMDETLVVEIRFTADAPLKDVAVVAVVYRSDNLIACNAISTLDDAVLELAEGQGMIDLTFDPLMLGAGEYSLGIGIYPKLDLSDPMNTQHAVISLSPQTFSVKQPSGVAVNLGVFKHPVSWRVRSHSC
jgi:ABC-type polysaccharide/polyol phosphate transport system ATPase subunit